jgi:hypothetical protein
MTNKFTGKFGRKPNTVIQPGEPNPNGLSSSLVSEDLREGLLPSSKVGEKLTGFRSTNFQRGVLLTIALLVLGGSSWFCFLGPAAPRLEALLANLAGNPPPSTQVESALPEAEVAAVTATKPALLPTATATAQDEIPATPTLTVTPTGTPTETPTATLEPSPTLVPITSTPTPVSDVPGCVPADLITLADVGKTLCVSGRVERTIESKANLIIVVVERPNTFYFVAYDVKDLYKDLEKRQCIYAIGEIRQLGFNPIMVLSYAVPLQFCP